MNWTSPPLARSRTQSMSFLPPTVRFATTRIFFNARYSFLGAVATVPAGAGATSPGFLNTPWTAPGTPYSYGPPTTVGTVSKLNTGGGGETCHSSVRARHGLASARGPPRQLAIML